MNTFQSVLILLLLLSSNFAYGLPRTVVITGYDLEAQTIRLSGKTYKLADNVLIRHASGAIGRQLLQTGLPVQYRMVVDNQGNTMIIEIEIITPHSSRKLDS